MSYCPQEEGFIEPQNLDEVKKSLKDEFNIHDKMDIFLRIRPILPAEILEDHKACISVVGDNNVRAKAPIDIAKSKSSHDTGGQEQNFVFTQAFGPDTDQIQFFETTMKSTIENFIQGQNGLVFAYGSSGSGKTYTMQGSYTKPGVIPLTIQLLFSSIKSKQAPKPFFKPHKYCDVLRLSEQQREAEESIREKFLGAIDLDDSNDSKLMSKKLSSVSLSTIFSDDSSWDSSLHSDLSEREMLMLQSSVRLKDVGRTSVGLQGEVLFSVWVSFMEVYNENIFDLLEPISSNKRTRLNLKEDENKNLYVKGLKEIRVNSSEEALKLLHLGKKNLRIASTKLNYQSSRSHCIFSMKVIRVLDIENPVSARVNKLSFCDLAGSERFAKTQNTGLRLKEASNINNSLLVLGRCIEALRQQGNRDKKIVPFRDSKLTRLFSAYFTGKGKASMIVNISPSSSMYNETVAVLKFSALAKQVVSSEITTKPSLHISREISRLTDAWERSHSRWSVYVKSHPQLKDSSFNAVGETSVDEMIDSFDEVSERDRIIEELVNHVNTLQTELSKVMMEKEKMEPKIRSEVCREFAEHFVQIEDCYRDQINGMEEDCDKISRKRSKFCKKADTTTGSCDVEQSKMSVDFDDDGSEDESNYILACESVSIAVSEKIISKVDESNMENSAMNHVDDGQSMEWVENMKNLITPQDVDPSSLHKQISELQQDVKKKENKLSTLDEILKSRDKDILELKEKIEEMSQATFSKNSKMKEYEDCLSSNEKQIKELEEKVKQQCQETSLGESFLGGLENASNPKEADDNQAKSAALEENVKKLEDALDSKMAEISSMEEKIIKLENALKSKDSAADYKVETNNSEIDEKRIKRGKVVLLKDKEIEEFENLVCSKVSEINALTEKMNEQNKVNGPKGSSADSAAESKMTAEIMELKKKIDEHMETISSKEKLLADFETHVHEKDVEIAALKKEREIQGNLKDLQDAINSKEADIGLLQEKINELEKALKSNEEKIQEFQKSDIRKLNEICALNATIEDQNRTISFKEEKIQNYAETVILKSNEISSLKATIEDQNETISSKEEEIQNYAKTDVLKSNEISALKAAIKVQDETISLKETVESANALNPNSKNGDLEALMKKLREQMEFIKPVTSAIPGNEMVMQSFNVLTNQNTKIDELTKECEGLKEKFASDNKLIVEKEEMLEEARKMLITKDKEILKLEKNVIALENKMKPESKLIVEKEEMLEDARKMLISKEKEIIKLEKNIIALENKIKPEKLSNVTTKEKDNSKELELILILEKMVFKAEADLKDANANVSKGNDEIVEKEKLLQEVQTLNDQVLCESKKYQETVLTQINELSQKDKLLQDLRELNDQILCEAKSTEESLFVQLRKVTEKEKLIQELQTSNSEILTGQENIQEGVPPTNTVNESLEAVTFLQKIEYISADNTVNLQKGNRKLSEHIGLLKESVVVLENLLEAKQQECIVQKCEIETLKKGVSSGKSGSWQDSPELKKHASSFVDVLQQIESISAENTKKLLSSNKKILQENSILSEELKSVKAELDMASQEIDTREREHIKMKSEVRRKEARIFVLEKDLNEAVQNAKALEVMHNTQMFEERNQHCTEIEQVMVLKRQVEAEYRKSTRTRPDDSNYESADKKEKVQVSNYESVGKKNKAQDSDNEFVDKKKKVQMPKRERRGRPKKLQMLEVQDDLEPPAKRRATAQKSYYEDEENTSPSSVPVITLDNDRLLPATSAPSSFQRLQEYVADKSPSIKSVAHRLVNVFSPKSGENEDSNASVLSKKKRRLFNNTCAPSLVTSPVVDIVSVISPKKIVAKKLRKRKTAK